MNYTIPEDIINELKRLKEESGISNKQLAEKSGIPESTITRIFTGQTPNPTAITYISLKNAMTSIINGKRPARMESSPQTEKIGVSEHKETNHTQATPPGLHQPCNYECHSHITQIREIYQNALKEKDKIIEDKSRQVKKLFWCLVGVIGFMMCILIIDLLIPTIGYFRY